MTINPPKYSAARTREMFADGFYAMSIYEIADALGISAEQVRRTEQVAIAKARAWCCERGISFEDLLPNPRHRLEKFER